MERFQLQIQHDVGREFRRSFGRTALRSRVEDILREAIELSRYVDYDNLREETGDILCSVLALACECRFDAEDLVKETLDKIRRRQDQYRTLGRKLSVALYGGSFDPPTLGHLQAARLVLDTSRTFDEVWLTPAYRHMYGKKLAPPRHRLAMCHATARCDGRIKVCDYEIVHRLKGDSLTLVKRMLAEDMFKHQVDLSFVMGMDCANRCQRDWVGWDEIERLIRFVVIPRPGVERDPHVNWYLKPPHIYIEQEGTPEVSSSDVRRKIEKAMDAWTVGVIKNISERKRWFEGMVLPEVWEYIRKHRVYIPKGCPV